MPYKFETDKIKLPEGKDRRKKLTDEDRVTIFELYAIGNTSQRKLADEFGVSRRTIQFVLDPEKRKQNVERMQERGGWKQYYDKDKNREYKAEHREYKKGVLSV